MRIARLIVLLVVCAGVAAFAISVPRAQTPATAPKGEPAGNLYAVEIKTGAAWDTTKSANEQPHFREHSSNLKRLRDGGSLVLGARYSDKGFVVLRAASEQEAHAMMQQDPSIQNHVFAYELHEFNVFYAGAVEAKRRRP